MNFEFEYFREVIDEELLDYLDELDKTTEKYYERIVFVDAESTDFQTAIRDAKIDLETEQQKGFVKRHQLLLIEFANELVSIMGEEGLEKDEDGAETRLNICRYLFDTVVELLTALELNFPQLFLMEVSIPDAYRLKAIKQLLLLLPELKAQLAEKGVEAKLLDVATEPLDEFLQADNSVIYSYGNMSYLNLLARELQKVATAKEDDKQPKDPAKAPRKALFKRLCVLNLNSDSFYDYIVELCSTKLEAAPGYTDKQMLLIRMLKKCINTKLMDESLLPGMPTIQESVKQWLLNEQQWLNEEIKLVEQNPKHGSEKQKESEREQEEDQEIYEGYKLPVKLTDGQLAFLVRLLVEFGIISEPVKEKIYRFFAKYFVTVRDKDTTGSTFKKRYNDPSMPAKMVVRGLLERMWRSI